MKILVLSHLMPTCTRPTRGVFVLEQVKALEAQGVSVEIVVPIPWWPRWLAFIPRFKKYSAVPSRSEWQGLPVSYPRVVAFPGAYKPGWHSLVFCAEALLYFLGCQRTVNRRFHEQRPDLIHAHTIMPDGFAAVLLGRKLKVPVVCTVHGSDVRIYPFASRPVGGMTRWTLRHIEHVIAVSTDLANAVQTLAGPKKVHVVRNGADATLFGAHAKADARKRLSIASEKKVVLLVGNLVEVKGVEFLIRAMATLSTKDAVAYIVGDGELRSSLTGLALSLGVSDRCHFMGSKPHEELGWWYSAADCLAMPSLSEGFPTVLAEAMMAGLPVVATCVGGITEVIRDKYTGLLVPPRDVTALAGAIDNVLTGSEAHAAVMAQEAQSIAREELTWKKNAEKTIAVYEEAMHWAPRTSTAAAD